MFRFFVARFLQALLAIFVAVSVVFVLTRVTGDPVLLFLPQDVAPRDIEEFRQRLGFDRPVYEQYFRFLWDAVQGDFGMSLRFREPAFNLVLARVPNTLRLGLCALIVTALLSIPLGIVAAVHRGKFIDRLVITIVSIGQAVPGFWLGLILIWVFSVRLGWLPTSGRGEGAEAWKHYILPTLTLTAFSASRIARVTRTSILEVLRLDYIRTANSKGLAPTRVLSKHVLKNASIPIITVFGLDAGALLGGAVVAETIFAWPGMGRYLVDALLARDFPIVIVGVLLTSALYLSINLIVDVAYAWLDPRIKVA
jgi:peptide/nickel transport system permease protein